MCPISGFAIQTSSPGAAWQQITAYSSQYDNGEKVFVLREEGRPLANFDMTEGQVCIWNNDKYRTQGRSSHPIASNSGCV